MKNFSFLILGVLLSSFSIVSLGNNKTDPQTNVPSSVSGQNTLSIMCSPELNRLADTWLTEYARFNPSVQVAMGNFQLDQTRDFTHLSLLSEQSLDAMQDAPIWKMVIGRDAIVPIINSANPMLEQLSRQGVASSDFRQLITEPQKQNWEKVINEGLNAPIHFYIIDNESINKGIANFINADTKSFNGIMVANAEELIAAVQRDIYAIGFCKLPYLMESNTNTLKENISLLPIDKNGNGRMDGFEKIYSNPDDFTRGVWVGKYPRALCGNVCAVSSSKPTDKTELAFLSWIMSDGQQFLNQSGYSILASNESQSNIDALAGYEIQLTQNDQPVASHTWLIVLLSLIIAGAIVTALIRYFRKDKVTSAGEEVHISTALNEKALETPGGLYFDKTHTWAYMEKDGTVKIGIDDFLQHITGTITGIKMKEPGEIIRKGEKIMTIIRNGKQLSIYAPVSGTVIEQNQALSKDSSVINSSPYADGWVYMIEPKYWIREIELLLMGSKYKEWLKDEFSRLKDFFAASVRSNTSAYAHIVLQDGGELSDNVLADLEPAVWEDFQTNFIDTSR